MANRYGKTGAQIIEERKKRMLQMQKKGIMRTGASILQSRGKIYPDYHSQDIYESPIDTLYKQTDVAKEEPVLPKPQLPKEFIEAQKITPSIISSNIPKEAKAPTTITTEKKSLWDRIKSWFAPEPDIVRKSVFGITYEDELEEAAREYVRKTTETPAGQFGIPFLRSATFGLLPRAVEAVTPKETREKLRELGYESIQDVYTEAQRKGGLISTAGTIAGSLIPLSQISKASSAILKSTGLAGKSPYLAKSLERILTGALYGAATTAGEGGKPSDIAKSAGRSALFMAAGGLASDIVGGAGRAALKYTALKDSLPADIVLNIIQGATFGAAGTAATIPTYKKEERPGTKEVLTTAITMALFSAIPATINSIKTAKANKQFLYNAMQQFENETYGLYNAARANRVSNPEESIRYYKELLNYINNNKTVLQKNRYIGQDKTVKAAIDLMDRLSNSIAAEMDMVVKGSASTLHRFIGAAQPPQTPPTTTTPPPARQLQPAQQVQQPEMVQQPKTIQQPLKQSKDKIPEYVQRIEEPNVKRATVEKPQGIYTSPSDIESPHKYLGGDVFYWKTNPDANILRIETGYFKTNRGFVGESAGIGAARKLFGDNEVVRMTKLSKQKLAKELSQKYPNVDWEKYYDQQEMIEGYAGLALRERGYDAIWAVDKEAPEFTEFVALTENAMTPVDKIETEEKPSIKQTVEQYTKDMTDKERKALNRYVINLTNQVVKNYEQNGNILTPEQVNELINKHLEIGKSVIEHIKNKNFDELTARLHRGNINSLNLFTDITGLSTKTQKETEKSIRALDPDAYDKWLEAKNLEIKKRREQEELEIMERELQQKTRYKNKIMTTKEFIDQIISEGFTNLSSEKKGVIPILRLSKGNESFAFSNKYERMYIEKAIKELESKKSELSKLDDIKTEEKPITHPQLSSWATKIKDNMLNVIDEYKPYITGSFAKIGMKEEAETYIQKIKEKIDAEKSSSWFINNRRYATGTGIVSLIMDSFPETKEKWNKYIRGETKFGEKEPEKPIAEEIKKEREEKPTIKNPSQSIADKVKYYLRTGVSFTADRLFEIANKVYGGTQAEGKYTVKDAYDAMELAVNQHILETPDYSTNVGLQDAKRNIEKLQEMLNKLPTQSKRTEEMERFQQYSTPPSIAYIANWVANITNKDVVLEPSAGIGGLAVFAKKEGAKVIVNELSERRLEILKQMGFDQEFNFDAEQIDNLLPDDIKPTVVIMNPPFSSAALRMGDKTATANAKRHIQQALNRLEDGGRLVAIVGQGMADNAPSFKDWWSELKGKYNIRANIGIAGENYRKYGTSFDIQLVVIDKTGPTTEKTLTGEVKDLTELPNLLEGIRNDRRYIERPRVHEPVKQHGIVPGSEKAPGQTRSDEPVSTTGSGEGTTAIRSEDGRGIGISEQRPKDRDITTRTKQTLRAEPGESIQTDDRTTRAGSDVSKPDEGKYEGGQIVRTDAGYRIEPVREYEPGRSIPDTGVVIEETKKDAFVEVNENDIYSIYYSKKLNIKGAKLHVTELVESAAMAAVEPPDVAYTPNLPEELITRGDLSIAQLENIVYAGQAHSQILPNGFRKGYFIGDGTGVGKGRQIAGIILDNFRQGRKKAVWISNDPKLYYDTVRDWTDLGQNKNDIINLSKIKADKSIEAESGIIFTSYATLRSESSKNPETTRVKQIVNWLGKDFDGVIVFDEAHNMSNAIEYGKGLKKTRPSRQALAGMDLQNALPNARIVYASATGATNVHNLAYLTRIGLWGEGTPFKDVQDFISKISTGGLAAMEVVARDMKSMGVYMARNLSFKGVEYTTLEHELTPIQEEIYNTMSRAWQKVLQNMNEALKITGGIKDGRAVGRAKSQFYGAMQRFYNQIITSMSMPSVIEDIKKELANGNAVVIQLVNTNQAATDRQIANANEKDLDLDDIDLTPSDTLIEYLKKSFPIYEYEEYIDEEGNTRTRIVTHDGKPVISKEAVRKRDALIEELKEMKVPDGPLEMLFDAFGVDNVAEVTGRTSRIVPKKDEKTGEIKRVLEKRSASHAIADAQAFQDGKKLILVFSDAGGTGKSYHADRNAKNQRERIHYLLQPGWNAFKATQGLGRTHRSGQVVPPLFKLVTTDIMGQKRFTSTIARRLDQMGALTKGQRQAGSGVFSERDNLENPIAREALILFYKDVINNRAPEIEIDANTLFTKMGILDKFTDEYGNLKENFEVMQDMNLFLNRILALEVDEQNKVFNAFYNRFNDLFDRKLAAGEIDVGLENYKAEKIELIDEKTIWKDKKTGAETKYLQLKALQKVKVIDFRFIKNYRNGFKGLVRINSTGDVRALYKVGNKTLSSGEIVPEYILLSPDYTVSRYIQSTVDSKTSPIPESEWEKAWNEQIAKIPKFREETIHMLSGTLLPVWDKLPLSYTKVMRVFTIDGKEYLGRIIKDEDIDITLGKFGANRQRESYTPEDIYNKIFYDGLTAILENDKVKLERRRVSGEYRIEITGNNIWFYARNIPGIITETINYQKRYFIPIGDKAIPIIKRIIDNNPVNTISKVKASNDLDSVEDTLADRLGNDDTGIPIGEIVKIVKQSITSAGTSIGEPGEGEYTFTDPGMERRWTQAKNIKGPFLEELKEKLQTIWDEIKIMTTRGAIPYLPRGAKYAQLRFNLLKFAKQKQISTYRTLINLKGIVSSLNKSTYDLFCRKVALDDMLEETTLKHELAFGFTDEDVKVELERINKEIDKYPEISEALKLRNDLWNALKDEYIKIMKEIDFPVENRLTKTYYYRHLIIDKIRSDRIVPGIIKLRTPTGAKYLRKRKGSLKDYVSDYLKAEAEVMANMLFDIEKAKLIKYVKTSEHNIKKELKQTAKARNKESLNAILKAEANDPNIPKNNRGEGPIQATLTEFNQYLAMSFGNLREIARDNKLYDFGNYEFRDIVDKLASGNIGTAGIDIDDEDASAFTNALYRYLSMLANTEDKLGNISARTILKYTSKRRQFIREILGNKYVTWRDIIPNGYNIWQPREGNYLYIAYTVPEFIADKLLVGMAETVNISREQLKEILTKGQPYEEFVLPDEVILCLDNLTKIKDEPITSVLVKKLTDAWKQWQLISPRRVVKYNIRNLTGDLDATLAGNPKILTKVLPAINELYGVYYHNNPIKGIMWEWFSRGGMQSTLQVNEIDDINQLKIFVDLYGRKDKLGDKIAGILKNYWKNARLSTDFREAILRYSAFLYAVEDIQKNNGKPSSYWASIKEEVDALNNIYDKAYMLSNDLLGAYDDVSIFGQYLRKYAIPFYSWMEINPKRYFRIIKNAITDDRTTVNVGKKTLRIFGITGIKSLALLRRIGKLILCLFGFSALTQVWNLLMFPDEEEQLPRSVRSRTHIILGKDENTGDILYFSRLGALGDILDWVGLDTAILDVKDFLAGRLTLKEYLIQMIQSPLNKIINAAYPYHKLAFELITGRSLFPDIFRQGQIRDAGLHIAQSFGLGDEYRALTGLPKKKGSYWESLKEIFYYRTNPDEAAYWDIIDLKERYLEKEGKPHGYAFWQDKKNKALYYLKVALRYKDKEAVDKYLYEYAIYGGTAKGLKQSLNNMNPLYGLKSDELVEFVSGLSEQDKDRLVQAMQFYVDTLNPDWDSVQYPNMIILEPK